MEIVLLRDSTVKFVDIKHNKIRNMWWVFLIHSMCYENTVKCDTAGLCANEARFGVCNAMKNPTQ